MLESQVWCDGPHLRFINAVYTADTYQLLSSSAEMWQATRWVMEQQLDREHPWSREGATVPADTGSKLQYRVDKVSYITTEYRCDNSQCREMSNWPERQDSKNCTREKEQETREVEQID